MKIKLGLGKVSMEQITQYTSGELYNFTGSTCEITYVCTDSREADEHTLFVATRGERVDGHDYILSASERGCRCFICEYVPFDISGKKLSFCVVENSFNAFADLARGYRQSSTMKGVAITGSVGKTTTKELMASVAKGKLEVYCTSGNFNSVIGMPMSLMEADGERELGIFEMGMSGFNEISSMSRTLIPDVAMVVNIGTSHLEYLGTRANIAKAKLEIAEGLKSGGTLILNGDEPLLENARDIVKREDINYIYTSCNNNGIAKYRAQNIRLYENGSLFDIYADGDIIRDIELCVTGAHIVNNALMVCACALILGIDEEGIRRGLKNYTPVGYRQRIYEKNGKKIIADCYNAAPESMRAALDVLSTVSKGRKIAVLGDMKELGKNSDTFHYSLGQYAAKFADILISVGDSGKIIAQGAVRNGMEDVYSFDENDIFGICDKINEVVTDGDCLLFKASRSMELERIIKELKLE